LKVAVVTKSSAAMQGSMVAELNIFQQAIDRAEVNLAEVMLLNAITGDATTEEINQRNQKLNFLRAALQYCLPVSGGQSYFFSMTCLQVVFL
jgi:hypothetical protein